MKMMTNEHTLTAVSGGALGARARADAQTYDAEDNDPVGVEDVGDPEREAEHYAQHAGPALQSAPMACCPSTATSMPRLARPRPVLATSEPCTAITGRRSRSAVRAWEGTDARLTIARRCLRSATCQQPLCSSERERLTEIPRPELFGKRHGDGSGNRVGSGGVVEWR